MKLLCYKKCSTCQKAKKWLILNEFEFEERDIKSENPTVEELSVWLKLSGLSILKLFNTSGLLYKSWNMKEKIKVMSEQELLDILASDGMMVKRPILIGDNFILVGFKEKEWREMLL